jgi:hypothetical protein
MTPARKPQHCDHECVCRHHDFEEMKDAPCYLKVGSCRCDTRTHTSPQAPILKAFRFEKDGLHFIPQNGCEQIISLQRHDTAIRAEAAKAAREQDIKILEDYRNSLDYPDCPPGDTIKRLIQSLRQPEPQQEGRL